MWVETKAHHTRDKYQDRQLLSLENYRKNEADEPDHYYKNWHIKNVVCKW